VAVVTSDASQPEAAKQKADELLKRKKLQELAQQRKEADAKIEAEEAAQAKAEEAAQRQRLFDECSGDVTEQLMLDVVAEEARDAINLVAQEDQLRLEKLEHLEEYVDF
jgi:hypothetical protein